LTDLQAIPHEDPESVVEAYCCSILPAFHAPIAEIEQFRNGAQLEMVRKELQVFFEAFFVLG
jgi:hypothetical protein